MKRLVIFLTSCLLFSQNSFTQQWWLEINADSAKGTFLDPRDSIAYPWIKIGDQVWMAKNLNYGKNKYFCYKGKVQNCETYGKLYPWNKIKKVCPNGWHVPDDKEWIVLTEYLGGESKAGGKMKEVGALHWESPNEGANNSSGFTALPGGCRDKNGYCMDLGLMAYFWSFSETDAHHVWARKIINGEESIIRLSLHEDKSLSVRCVKDAALKHFQDPPKKAKLYSTWIKTMTSKKIMNIYIYEINEEDITVVSKNKYERIMEGKVMSETDLTRIAVDNTDVISFRKKGNIWKGSLIGCASGIGIGALIGWANYEQGGGGMFYEPGFVLFIGMAMGAVCGTAIGFSVGLLKNRYPINGKQATFELVRHKLEKRSIRYYYK